MLQKRYQIVGALAGQQNMTFYVTITTISGLSAKVQELPTQPLKGSFRHGIIHCLKGRFLYHVNCDVPNWGLYNIFNGVGRNDNFILII